MNEIQWNLNIAIMAQRALRRMAKENNDPDGEAWHQKVIDKLQEQLDKASEV